MLRPSVLPSCAPTAQRLLVGNHGEVALPRRRSASSIPPRCGPLPVEHFIREENMMAAQEILELFCELVAVRLPVIEAQKECPIDLKEAICSICFAAPRCADLPELMQVQMMSGTKYGKESVAAATELMPYSGVNQQIIELLSVRPPPVDVKMKLLKEIAEEHEIDWDQSATETEYLKPHEDLLDGPTYFSGSTLPLPKEKHEETVAASAADQPNEDYESDSGFDSLEKQQFAQLLVLHQPQIFGPHVQSSQSSAHEFSNPPDMEENPTADAAFYNDLKSSEPPVSTPFAQPILPALPSEKKQFLPRGPASAGLRSPPLVGRVTAPSPAAGFTYTNTTVSPN